MIQYVTFMTKVKHRMQEKDLCIKRLNKNTKVDKRTLPTSERK